MNFNKNSIELNTTGVDIEIEKAVMIDIEILIYDPYNNVNCSSISLL